MNKMDSALSWAESQPRKRGKSSYIKFLKGQRISIRQAVEATCFRCTDFAGCSVIDCPLILFSPYAASNATESKSDSL